MWSPIIGCSKVSLACDHCVERAWNARLVRPWMESHRDSVLGDDGEWNGNIVYMPELLSGPFRAPRPLVLNVGVASDLFHDNVKSAWRAEMFGVIARLRRHHFVVPTRRAANAAAWLSDSATLSAIAAESVKWDSTDGVDDALDDWPLPNVTIAVSVENQEAADALVPILAGLPAARRLVECSPLLGPIDLSPWADSLDWVTVSGVYGADGQGVVSDPAWVTGIAEFCDAHNIPMFFHGWGSTFDGERRAEAVTAAMGSELLGWRGVSNFMVGGVMRRAWPGFHEV